MEKSIILNVNDIEIGLVPLDDDDDSHNDKSIL